MAPRQSSKRGRKPAPEYTNNISEATPALSKGLSGSSSSKYGSNIGGISDQLRQAVKDLGGDDSDLELIQGVDDDEDGEESVPSKTVSGSDEVSLLSKVFLM